MEVKVQIRKDESEKKAILKKLIMTKKRRKTERKAIRVKQMEVKVQIRKDESEKKAKVWR
jgi:hypothetical protein